MIIIFFFFNDTATTEIYTLSLHDALPIFLDADERIARRQHHAMVQLVDDRLGAVLQRDEVEDRSEEHTSELQSQSNLVCRLLLEKKNITIPNDYQNVVALYGVVSARPLHD